MSDRMVRPEGQELIECCDRLGRAVGFARTVELALATLAREAGDDHGPEAIIWAQGEVIDELKTIAELLERATR